jgi:hypothetical protein
MDMNIEHTHHLSMILAFTKRFRLACIFYSFLIEANSKGTFLKATNKSSCG